jgi:hypothetical protein
MDDRALHDLTVDSEPLAHSYDIFAHDFRNPKNRELLKQFMLDFDGPPKLIVNTSLEMTEQEADEVARFIQATEGTVPEDFGEFLNKCQGPIRIEKSGCPSLLFKNVSKDWDLSHQAYLWACLEHAADNPLFPKVFAIYEGGGKCVVLMEKLKEITAREDFDFDLTADDLRHYSRANIRNSVTSISTLYATDLPTETHVEEWLNVTYRISNKIKARHSKPFGCWDISYNNVMLRELSNGETQPVMLDPLITGNRHPDFVGISRKRHN